MNGRGRIALVALAVLAIYLLGYALSVAEENRGLQKANRAAIAELQRTQGNVVEQLATILEKAILAEQAGQAEKGTVESILEKVNILDPALVERAVEEATRRTGVPVAPPGPRGPVGPQGPPGAAAPATTSTAPATTTSTTRPPTTTTSAPTTTTTTTRPCTLGLDMPGLARLCL